MAKRFTGTLCFNNRKKSHKCRHYHPCIYRSKGFSSQACRPPSSKFLKASKHALHPRNITFRLRRYPVLYQSAEAPQSMKMHPAYTTLPLKGIASDNSHCPPPVTTGYTDVQCREKSHPRKSGLVADISFGKVNLQLRMIISPQSPSCDSPAVRRCPPPPGGWHT